MLSKVEKHWYPKSCPKIGQSPCCQEICQPCQEDPENNSEQPCSHFSWATCALDFCHLFHRIEASFCPTTFCGVLLYYFASRLLRRCRRRRLLTHTHTLSYTTLSYTPLTRNFVQTTFPHKLSFTDNFVRHCHIQLCPTLSFIQLCHTQLYHTQLCHTWHLVTCNLALPGRHGTALGDIHPVWRRAWVLL